VRVIGIVRLWPVLPDEGPRKALGLELFRKFAFARHSDLS